jgi:hypothetical protein
LGRVGYGILKYGFQPIKKSTLPEFTQISPSKGWYWVGFLQDPPIPTHNSVEQIENNEADQVFPEDCSEGRGDGDFEEQIEDSERINTPPHQNHKKHT